jgi:hypothetical protein
MAMHLITELMQSKRNITVDTLRNEPTATADKIWIIAAPVLKQDHLFIIIERRLDTFLQLRADHYFSFLRNLCGIDNFYFGKMDVAISFSDMH